MRCIFELFLIRHLQLYSSEARLGWNWGVGGGGGVWNDNCEAISEAKSPRPLRGLQVDFSLTRNVSYAVR